MPGPWPRGVVLSSKLARAQSRSAAADAARRRVPGLESPWQKRSRRSTPRSSTTSSRFVTSSAARAVPRARGGDEDAGRRQGLRPRGRRLRPPRGGAARARRAARGPCAGGVPQAARPRREVTQTRRGAEFDKAEMEFRHAVGEIDDAELAERVADPGAVLARCKQQLSALDAMKAPVRRGLPRGGGRLGRADDTCRRGGAGAAPAPAAPALSSAEDGRRGDRFPCRAGAADEASPHERAPGRAEEAPVEAVAADFPVEEEAEPVAAAAGPGEVRGRRGAAGGTSTRRRPRCSRCRRAVRRRRRPPRSVDATASPTPSAASPEDDRDGDATFILPDAVLVDAATATPEFRLGAMNYIGRADDNQVRLKSGDVSRRHAMVSVASGQYLLRDLQSQNGTFVNGQRVAEHCWPTATACASATRTRLPHASREPAGRAARDTRGPRRDPDGHSSRHPRSRPRA